MCVERSVRLLYLDRYIGTDLQPNWDIQFPVATGSDTSGVPSWVARGRGQKHSASSESESDLDSCVGLMSRFPE
jgi:hypothetical protein